MITITIVIEEKPKLTIQCSARNLSATGLEQKVADTMGEAIREVLADKGGSFVVEKKVY